MKAKIWDTKGFAGTMEVSDGEFVWSFEGEDLAVRSVLVQASLQEKNDWPDDVEREPGETGLEVTTDMSPSEKFEWAIMILGQHRKCIHFRRV